MRSNPLKSDIVTQWVFGNQMVPFIFAELALALKLRKSHLTKA